MGTNYYTVAYPKCECCGRGPDRGMHIGKSSGGWVFSLRVYDNVQEDYPNLPTIPVKTWDAWKTYLSDNFQHVLNEYGELVTLEEFFDTVENRSWPGKDRQPYKCWTGNICPVDKKSGLWRHPLEQNNCWHGEGTWDYCAYEFS